MRQQIDSFLNSLRVEKGYSNNTIVAYRNDLVQFAEFLASEADTSLWAHVTKDDLIGYVNSLKGEREYASATVARKVAATKSFFHHLVSLGILNHDPSATLDSPKVRKYLPTSISQEDIARLLQAPRNRDDPRGQRDSALLELLYATGMRVSEVVDLDLDDVDVVSCTVRCLQKNSKNRDRVIPIFSRRAVEALEQYLLEGRPMLLRAGNESALFLNHRGRRLTRQGLWLIIKKYVAEVGVEGPVTPHTLRHSFATHLLSDGADVREVQGLLGHANISTTQVYTQISQDRPKDVYEGPRSET